MEAHDVNRQLVKILNEWDPFRCGTDGYDPEIADVIYAVHEMDQAHDLAIKTQSIYEHSFEELIPYESCLLIAKSLLAVKSQGTCTL